MTMTIAIERQKSEMRAVLRCPAMQTLTKWVTAMLFISLIWHAPQAHAAWASSEVVISAGAAVVLDSTNPDSNSSKDPIIFVGKYCPLEEPAVSYALIRPDVGVLMQKLNITDLESVDLDSLIAGAVFTIWVNRTTTSSGTLQVYSAPYEWSGATKLTDVPQPCCPGGETPLSVDLRAQKVGEWTPFSVNLGKFVPTWLRNPAKAGLLLAVSPSPDAPACTDSRVAITTFAQPPGQDEIAPGVKLIVQRDQTPPVATLVHPSPASGGYVTTAALFAQMAVVEEESGLARLECARGSEVFRPCPMHRGDALRIDLAKIDSSSGVKNLVVRPVDKAGNLGQAVTVQYQVDFNPPTIAFSPATMPSPTNVTGMFNIEMNVTEAESGLAAIHCALDSPFQVESEDWRKLPQCGRAANFSSLRSGPHEFVAVAVDKAGNVSRVLRHKFQVQLPPTSTLVVEYASKDVVQLKARFSEPVDVFKPECIAASIGYSKPNWGQLAGTPTKAEDGKVWSMQMIPDEATVQRMSAGPNQLSFVVVSNCMRTRSGAATIYIGNARVATDLTPLKCTPFAPPRVVLGDPIVATFELSKGNARVHSLDDIRVMDLVGETAGTLVSASVENRTLTVSAIASEPGDVVISLGEGALTDVVGAHSPPCVTKAITVAKGGLLALTEGGTVVSSNPAADEPEPTTIPFPAVSPLSLATAKGRIAATTSSGTAVTAAKLDGTLVWTAGGFERLVGVAVDSAGVVVALDAHGPTLTRLDAVTGETLFTVGPGLESAPDDSFEDLARDALGGGRERGEEGLRQVPDQEEEDQGSGVRSVISHALQSPRGVSMDMRGFVYVLERPGVEGEGGEDLPAEMGAGGEEPDGVMLGAMLEEDESAAVVVLDRDLTLVAVIDSWGDVPIREPVGIALTAEGVLLVADRGLGVVLGYDAVDSYAPLAAFGPVDSIWLEEKEFAPPSSTAEDVIRVTGRFDDIVGLSEVDPSTALLLLRKEGLVVSVPFNVEEPHLGDSPVPVPGQTSFSALRFSTVPTLNEILPEGGYDQTGPFTVTFVWSEPVTDFDRDDVNLWGIGGDLVDLHTEDGGITYSGTVKPLGVGTLTISVGPRAVKSMEGMWNIESSETVRVRFSGGRCAAELSCQWSLAFYEHELAIDRMRVEATLQKQAMVAAEHERARIRVQEERGLAMEREAQERRLQKARAEGEGMIAREKAVVEAELLAKKMEMDAALKELDKEVAAEAAKAEATARIEERRATQHLRLEEIREEGTAKSAAFVAAAIAVMQSIGAAILDTISNPARLRQVMLTFAGFAFLFYSAREGARLISDQLARLLTQPPLVRETTVGWANVFKRLLKRGPGEVDESLLDEVVLPGHLHNRMSSLARAVSQTKARGAPFRHMLLYGPPGTGKTMVATRLAKGCGMDYALMSGGDVLPLGPDAVKELNRLFAWAKSSKRGLILFIDEADAFLRRRGATSGGRMAAPSENLRAAINAVLAQTGTQQSHFMMVLASNRPQDLDDAVMDRIDETVGFPKPGMAEREKMLRKYFRVYLGRVPTETESVRFGPLGLWDVTVDPYTAAIPDCGYKVWSWALWRFVPRAVRLEGISDELFKEAARLTEGFSGREIDKAMAAVQAAVYGSPEINGEMMLQASLFLDVIRRKVAEHGEKENFLSDDLTGTPPVSVPPSPAPILNGLLPKRAKSGKQKVPPPPAKDSGRPFEAAQPEVRDDDPVPATKGQETSAASSEVVQVALALDEHAPEATAGVEDDKESKNRLGSAQ